MKKIVIFTCLLLSLSLTGSVFGAVLIDLDASGLPEGDLTSWANAGTAGGTFLTADRPDDGVVDPNAIVTTIDGKKGVYFANDAWMESDITTPAILTGANPPFTVMVWADPNGASQTGQDTLFQWADRDFGDSCASLNAGTDYAFTTFTDDVFWPAPTPVDQWAHIACTYDGTTFTLYVNGLVVSEVEREYDFKDGNFMRIARQLPDVYGTHPYTGAIASIQVHDAALTSTEIHNIMGEFIVAGELSPAGQLIMEGGVSADLTLQINENNLTAAGPTTDLEVTLSFAGTYADAALGTSAVGDPYVITVPAATYSDPITISIVAEDDEILEAPHEVVVEAVITAGDPAYVGTQILPVGGLAVTVLDNDYDPCPAPAFSAGSYTDNFDCPWDFGQGVTGMWDGFMNAGNASSAETVIIPGDLHMASVGGWGGGDSSGPFLYKEVTGDFVAEVHVDPENWEGFACGGLMVRLADVAAGGDGEDNMFLAYWPVDFWGVGTIFWPTDNNDRPEYANSGYETVMPSYFRVERRSAAFYWSRSYDGVNWEPIEQSPDLEYPLVRDDMNVSTLQVGLVQTFGDWAGQNIYFDYFKLTPTRGTLTGDLNLTESIGESGTVQFQLDPAGVPAPLADIDVTLSAVVAGGDPNTDPNDIAIGTSIKGVPYAFTIPAASYDQPQTIDVAAVIDADPELDQLLTLSADIVSTDPNWNGLFLANTSLINVMEVPGLLIDEGDGVEVSEDGAGDTFTVRLKTVPTAAVSVAVADDADPDQVTATASLSFTDTDFMTPKTVSVAAVDDAVLETDPHTTTLTLTSSNGAEYDTSPSGSVAVSILENECGAWSYNWADFDKDCDVDLADLQIMAGAWLDCSNPYDPGCADYR